MKRAIQNIFHEVGAQTLFFLKVTGAAWRHRAQCRSLVLQQIADVWARSLGTVCFAGFFVGAILVIQFYMMLTRYDALAMLGGLNASATVREIGPLIISFLLAGKVGAYTAAELGTMRVTEQIDAVSCLGTDPIVYLVAPRFTAIIVCSLLLLVFGLMVGIAGSMFVADALYGINMLQYSESVPRFTDAWTVAGGVFKCLVYGAIVATVSTYKGYTASGGAAGVGRAVTLCAVYTNLFIVLANYVTSQILQFLFTLGRGAVG